MLYGFDKEEYYKYGAVAKGVRDEIEKVAIDIHNEGYSKILFTGVGGTTAEFESILSLLKDKSDVEAYNLSAAELLCHLDPRIDKDTIVITGSKSGDTKETVGIIEKCKELGIRVFAITGNPESPVAVNSSHPVIAETKGIEFTIQMFFYFTFKLLELRGDFPEYEKFADQLDNTADIMYDIKTQFEEDADKIAKAHHADDYQIWIGSGENYGDIYLFAMCILEECQWMRTKSVTSAEFFHGTIELTDEKTPMFLVKGIGKYRQLDQRVDDFLSKHSGNYVCIDLADFDIKGVDEEFKYMYSPMITETLTSERLAKHIEKYSGHDLDTRRFYRQMEY